MPSRVRRALLAAAILPAATALAAACSTPPPVVGIARLSVDPPRARLGGSLQVNIRFDVAPTLTPLSEDYRVFLHVLDDNQRFLWAAEHDPPVPTSAWQPGQTVQYTERIRVPPYPYVGPAVIAIGLHAPDSGERLALAGDDVGGFAYRVATLTLEPQHESSFIAYDEGWHQVEVDALSGTEWRWTTGRAVLSFRNPYGPVRLLLGVEGRPSVFDRPQQLAFVVGERTLREVTLDAHGPVSLEYDLTASDLGEDDIVRLELLVDRTFVPLEHDSGASDTRELGVRVFDLRTESLPDR